MVPVEYGKSYTVSITGMTREGNGAGRIGGFSVFVPSAVPGDVVTAEAVQIKKSYALCKLTGIVTPSPIRVEPRCASCGECGACGLMCVDYAEQLKIKRGFIEDCMRRIGGFRDFTLDSMIGMDEPYRYRNKSAFPLVRTADGIRFGCFERESHRVIPIADCVVGAEEVGAVCSAVCRFMDENGVEPFDEEARTGEIRRVIVRKSHADGSVMAIIAANTGKFKNKEALCAAIANACPSTASIVLNICGSGAGFSLGRRSYTLWGSDTIEDELCGIRFKTSPNSFFQINHEQTERLYGKVIELARIDSDSRVMDVYCGVGTISLIAAKTARSVTGIEIVKDAVENARANAERNGIRNTRFYAGDAADTVGRLLKSRLRPDVVILDPPRKGSDKRTLSAVCAANPERIVYVSCDPATLARDARLIAEAGYTPESAAGVDMFPHTGHVETVVLLSKGEIDSKKVRVEFSLEDMDMSGFRNDATYAQIKERVLEQTGLKVSSLYIAQIKQKYGIIERENYNKPKSENARQPKCPIEKEKAITEALRYFGMI